MKFTYGAGAKAVAAALQARAIRKVQVLKLRNLHTVQVLKLWNLHTVQVLKLYTSSPTGTCYM